MIIGPPNWLRKSLSNCVNNNPELEMSTRQTRDLTIGGISDRRMEKQNLTFRLR